ncbi:Uncharacterised protein [Orientia tsutsugamushi]|uniref:Uncharacterized protein n=1 Tax=Orientia tsutsugamushi TaxID=784 RepID=A0A2U3QN05_ORITS|nr:hypothetical protein OTSUT76_0917 [Orientia tsutsugamushi str. UT76]SPR02334.1 Uncharacterised protein [Orientia tsutsugamushi]
MSHGGVYWVIQEILGLPIIDLANAEPVFHQPPAHPNASMGYRYPTEGIFMTMSNRNIPKFNRGLI